MSSNLVIQVNDQSNIEIQRISLFNRDIENIKLTKLVCKTIVNTLKLVGDTSGLTKVVNSCKKIARYDANLLYLNTGKIDPSLYEFTYQGIWAMIEDNKSIRTTTRDALIALTPIVVAAWAVYLSAYAYGDPTIEYWSAAGLGAVTTIFNVFKQIRKVSAIYHGHLLRGKNNALEAKLLENPQLAAAIQQFVICVHDKKREEANAILPNIVAEIAKLIPEETKDRKKAEKKLFKEMINGQIKEQLRHFTVNKAFFKALNVGMNVASFFGVPLVDKGNKAIAVVTGIMAAYKRRYWSPEIKAEINYAEQIVLNKKEKSLEKKGKFVSLYPVSWIMNKITSQPKEYGFTVKTG